MSTGTKRAEGDRVLPTEMVILLAIAEAGEFGREVLARPMGDVPGEYIGHLYQSLVRRGYLRQSSSRGYQLTAKGGAALIEFLHKNETRVRQTIKALKRLRIEIGQEIDKVKKEATVVK
ncbi:hypothetical protein ES703_84527 [subsurface metagenome]